ncbi:DUF4309 domain-containing protein [Vallitalea okinawensis]|uniref:DUF4309 domain-containing protein n=1 Tax=Vallitalea okinawensis TaxID=2078660 RepID=UPI000CFC9C73|nr:DUF4309 domain-containing protein [Vallitalea okinawensis]
MKDKVYRFRYLLLITAIILSLQSITGCVKNADSVGGDNQINSEVNDDVMKVDSIDKSTKHDEKPVVDKVEKSDEIKEVEESEMLDPLQGIEGGELENVRFGLGTKLEDIATELGEPDQEGWFSGYYINYDDIFYFGDGSDRTGSVSLISVRNNHELLGVKLGMTTEEIIEVLGSPDLQGFIDSDAELSGGSWYISYIRNGYVLSFYSDNMNEKTNLLDYMKEKRSVESGGVNTDVVLSFYEFGADDYDNPEDIKVITISEEEYNNNLVKVLNLIFSESGISLNNLTINEDEKLVIADLTEAASINFDNGSCGGITRTNVLVMTLLNLPGVEKLKVTVEGVENVYGNHFSFEGIFMLNENGGYDLLHID